MAMVALVAVMFIAATAQATFVFLVPDTLNVAPGSTVNVSVNMSVDSPGFDMAAISAAILYDPAVFTYVDPVVQGAFLQHDWSGGLPLGAAANPGELRIGGID